MSQTPARNRDSGALPNGAGAAAALAAGIGCFALGILSIAGDKSNALKALLNFYAPSGPLSGVTTCAVAIWLAAWAILNWRWHRLDVALGRINAIAFLLLGLGLLLTFPRIGDLF